MSSSFGILYDHIGHSATMKDMTHNTEVLIASERERWLKLHLEGGLSMVELAERSGFARSTLYLWKDAYEKEGIDGLREKSRAHHAHPKTTAPEMVALIRAIRNESRLCLENNFNNRIGHSFVFLMLLFSEAIYYPFIFILKEYKEKI